MPVYFNDSKVQQIRVGVSPEAADETPLSPFETGAAGTSEKYARADHQHPSELPSGGSAGQILTKTASGEEWASAPSGLPDGGSVGQVLTKTADGAAWQSASSGVILDAIRITTAPSKTAYKAGETFSTAGMVIKADYSNGTVVIIKDIVVTGWNITPSGALAAGTTKVTVQYTENGVTKTADQAITVTKTSVTVPSLSSSLTYTGSAQSPTWSNYDSSKMTLGGTTNSTGAGSYNATFTLKDTALYCWTDGTTAAKTVSWSIGKAAGTLSLSPETMTLKPGTTSGTFTITTNSTGTISVSSSSSIVTVSRSGKTVTVTSVGDRSGTATITVSVAGDSNYTAPSNKTCTVKCAFVSLYGVSWDGTSTTKWSRTDDAAGFVDPVAAVNNGTGSSPFDTLMPWSGMEIVDDATCGKLVSIPKYWYKWTKSGNQMTLQIADSEQDGFNVSPAHADRGDGSGERDVVYVGRYHCVSGYKSSSGTPLANITRATARTNIHNLGSTVWQYDFAMYWTIMMLYLVEYADWNSQNTIGYGCGNGSDKQAQGATDAMTYHTGTTAASRTTYAVGIQYRHIEGLWSNVFDWCDGIYFSGANVYAIKNPASFSDTSGGTNIGTRPTSSNWIRAWSIPSVSGFEYALYPSAVTGAGSANTYVCDCCYYNVAGVTLRVGGYYIQSQDYGAFYIFGYNAASYAFDNIGCRLQKLP